MPVLPHPVHVIDMENAESLESPSAVVKVAEAHARLQGAGLPERGSEIAGGRRHWMLSDNWQ